LPKQAPRRWINVITGEQVAASSSDGRTWLLIQSLLNQFPVALLHNAEVVEQNDSEELTIAASFDHIQ
jgi:hypothetical protein